MFKAELVYIGSYNFVEHSSSDSEGAKIDSKKKEKDECSLGHTERSRRFGKICFEARDVRLNVPEAIRSPHSLIADKCGGRRSQSRCTATERVCFYLLLFIYQWQGSL